MNTVLKLSEQETKVVNFLQSRNNEVVAWEELAQFAKSPQTVKRKSCQKMVSEVRRKYTDAGLTVPFKVEFFSMGEEPNKDTEDCMYCRGSGLFGDELSGGESYCTCPEGEQLKKSEAPPQQTLVQVKRTPGGNTMLVSQTKNLVPAQVDFKLDVFTKSIKTRNGSHKLNDNEWNVMKYIHENPGRLLSISELRDKVVFPQYGSKLPARWFDSIMRIVNNLRRQVPELNGRLLTVKAEETSYLFQ